MEDIMVLEESMRRARHAFIVVSPTARTDTSYPLRGYAGASGRIDVVAVSMIASSSLEDSMFMGVLLGPPSPPLTIFTTPGCRPPKSERGAVSWIRVAVAKGSYECLRTARIGLLDAASMLVREGFRLVVLSEDGIDFPKAQILGGKTAFILGSHVDIPEHLMSELYSVARPVKASVGPRSLHSSHVILLVSWLLRGQNRSPG